MTIAFLGVARNRFRARPLLLAAASVWALSLVVGVGSAAGRGDDPTEPVTIPSGLLLYKHAPDTIGDDQLLQMTKQQVSQDQSAYKHPQAVGDPIRVFSKQQVEGRAVDFAAKDLLPAYKAYLTRLTGQIPARLHFSTTRSLGLVEYSDGAVRTKSQPYFSREFKLAASERRGLPSDVQGWEILGQLPPIAARVSDLRLTDVTRSFQARGRRMLLALNRDPEIPPLAMNSADAEQIWKRPECAGNESEYIRSGMTKAAAVKAAAECRARHDRYRDAIQVVFDIEIQKIVATDRAWIIQAQLVGANVYGPHQSEPIKTFAAGDFTPISERLAAVQRDEQRAADQQRSRIAALSQMDVLGVRLGMSMREAESLLRAKQKIQTVYRFSASPLPRSASASGKRRPEPYSSGLLFIANDGNDAITLFQAEDAVIGVTRRMLAAGVTQEAVTDALTEKYGQPTHTGSHGSIWGKSGDGCSGGGNLDARSPMQLIEGQPIKNITYKAVGIGVRHEAKADTLANCTTVLQMAATLKSTPNPHVDFRLFNHSAVAGAFKEAEDQQKPLPGGGRGKLKL